MVVCRAGRYTSDKKLAERDFGGVCAVAFLLCIEHVYTLNSL
jgi:hypothetical protein